MNRIKLGSILHMEKGRKPKHQQAEMAEGLLPYVDIKAFEEGIINSYAAPDKCLLCNDGDLLIVCDGSRSGLTGYAIKGVVGSTLSKISADGLTTKYLQYFIQSKYILLNTRKKGTGTPHLNTEILKRSEVVIPTIPEQEHIVSKIEELFSRLDASVAELQTAKEKLKVYRQAVLKEAFEGKLSETWRLSSSATPQSDFLSICKQNPSFKDTSGDENEITLHIPTTWLKVRIGDIFDVEVGSTPKRSIVAYWNGTINWVSSGEVHFNAITTTKEKITEAGLANSSTNLQPAGTVLLAMIGEGKTRGQAAILNTNAAHNQNTAAILVSKTPCDPKYIYYFLLLNYENTRRVGSGNNQKALNKERVRALRFPFTSFEEQRIIVSNIESRFSVFDSIERTIDASLQQAEVLRQSILKQAFEGGL